MIDLNQKLSSFKKKERLPQSLLIVCPKSVRETKDKIEKLLNKVLVAYTDSPVSEAKGNLILIGEDQDSSIKVDDIREVLESLSLARWEKESKRFVFVPHAENLTTSSSNALLKSLEEPSEGTHFILAVSSRRSVLKTILSRSSVINIEEKDLGYGLNDESHQGQVFLEAFFKGELSELESLNRVDFKLAFEDFKSLLKEKFIEESFSGHLNRSIWFDLFEHLEKMDKQMNSHTDTKWLVRSIDEFAFKNKGKFING